jgi:fermentation-respiration switch protein FrsA (DUF1100 family)
MMDMAKQTLHLPLGFLVHHRFDNAARLNELASSNSGSGKFIIFHGTTDEVIPVEMARTLKAATPASIELHEVPGGRHNDIFSLRGEEIATAMAQLH